MSSSERTDAPHVRSCAETGELPATVLSLRDSKPTVIPWCGVSFELGVTPKLHPMHAEFWPFFDYKKRFGKPRPRKWMKVDKDMIEVLSVLYNQFRSSKPDTIVSLQELRPTVFAALRQKFPSMKGSIKDFDTELCEAVQIFKLYLESLQQDCLVPDIDDDDDKPMDVIPSSAKRAATEIETSESSSSSPDTLREPSTKPSTKRHRISEAAETQAPCCRPEHADAGTQTMDFPVMRQRRVRKAKAWTMCFRCNGFGHFANSCEGTERCLRCEGEHRLRDCTTPKSAPHCINCSVEGHMASSRDCPARPARPLLPEKTSRRAATTTTKRAAPQIQSGRGQGPALEKKPRPRRKREPVFLRADLSDIQEFVREISAFLKPRGGIKAVLRDFRAQKSSGEKLAYLLALSQD